MSWLPGIARLFFPTAESLAIVRIVADACVSEDARRRTTRTAGTASSKNRRRHRAMFTPSTEERMETILRLPVHKMRTGGQVQHTRTRHAHLTIIGGEDRNGSPGFGPAGAGSIWARLN